MEYGFSREGVRCTTCDLSLLVLSKLFLANNVYQQLQFCFAYSSCNEGFFVLHYVLCDFVCVSANFLGFIVVFYGLLVVLCYPFYMCGTDNVVLSQPAGRKNSPAF